MGKSPEQKIAMMVDGAQPHCDEPLESAMICTHPGSTAGALISAFSSLPAGGPTRTSELPNPVLIAVGPNTIYAFKYTPKGFKVKVKKGAEVARWPRSEMRVEAGEPGKIAVFALITSADDVYTLEVVTAMGGREAYQLFIDALTSTPG